MFDFVQEKKRLVQIVLALIILPFAFWGVDSYRKSGGAAPLATVNGEKISQQEFENALKQQQQRIREMAGANFDPAFFDKPEIKLSILDGLVTQHLLGDEARRIGLSLTDEQIVQIIASIGVFQTDGKFDKKRYAAVLNEKGMNRFEFENRIRQDLLVRQLTDAYTQNGYASDTEAANLIRLNEQQRVVAVASINAADFVKQVKLSESAIGDYYNRNAQEFQMPERANVEYVVLSADSLLSQVTVNDEDVKQYYEEHQAEFGTQEQRQAAHILITVSKQASDAEKQAAKAKAEQVLQQVKQSPAKFAELAKQYSQDLDSAPKGGALPKSVRGAMPRPLKPLEDEIYRIKQGEIGDLVQTDFGFHIVKLLVLEPAKPQPLNEVRTLIVQRLKSQQANDKFAELAEKFNNTVYEQSDSLKPAAELIKAPVQRGVWLSKGQLPSGLWTDKALQAVFSDDVLKNKRNTSAVEVGANTLLAARVVEYKPASQRPLDEVSTSIRQKLEKTQAVELAAQQGKKMLEQLQHGEKVTLSWKAGQSISRSQRSSIEPELARAVFHADIGNLPAYVGVDGSTGYLLARIDAVKEAAPSDENKRTSYEQQIRQITGEELLTAYLADLKKRATISMKDFAAEEKK